MTVDNGAQRVVIGYRRVRITVGQELALARHKTAECRGITARSREVKVRKLQHRLHVLYVAAAFHALCLVADERADGSRFTGQHLFEREFVEFSGTSGRGTRYKIGEVGHLLCGVEALSA